MARLVHEVLHQRIPAGRLEDRPANHPHQHPVLDDRQRRAIVGKERIGRRQQRADVDRLLHHLEHRDRLLANHDSTNRGGRRQSSTGAQEHPLDPRATGGSEHQQSLLMHLVEQLLGGPGLDGTSLQLRYGARDPLHQVECVVTLVGYSIAAHQLGGHAQGATQPSRHLRRQL